MWYNSHKAKNTQNTYIVHILCLGMHLCITQIEIMHGSNKHQIQDSRSYWGEGRDGFGKVNTQVLIALFFVPFVYVKYCVFEGLWTL